LFFLSSISKDTSAWTEYRSNCLIRHSPEDYNRICTASTVDNHLASETRPQKFEKNRLMDQRDHSILEVMVKIYFNHLGNIIEKGEMGIPYSVVWCRRSILAGSSSDGVVVTIPDLLKGCSVEGGRFS
jgi:hypothetical protein